MSLREHIPAPSRAIMTLGFGESERALLEYYTGVMSRPVVADPQCALIKKSSSSMSRLFVEEKNFDCDWLLVAGGDWQEKLPSCSAWVPVWEGLRPSNPTTRPREIFTLLTRNSGKKICVAREWNEETSGVMKLW